MYKFQPEFETMPRAKLAELQLERMKKIVKHAYDNVPHYKKSFDAAGVKQEHLQTNADIAKFPFTVKTDLRDNYPFAMFAVPREKVLRIHASSGTTGKPTVVGYTEADLSMWADLMARSMASVGVALITVPKGWAAR